MKHWKYLSYVVRHKWFVFRAGLKIGVPLWRLIRHDWTKFLPCEWFPYVEYFYGIKNPSVPCLRRLYGDRPNDEANRELYDKERRIKFNRAWLHHQHNNDHHWQHWVLREDSGTVLLLDIPLECLFEMVADWAGAGRAITGKWEVAAWYEKNKEKIQLNDTDREIVETLLKVFKTT